MENYKTQAKLLSAFLKQAGCSLKLNQVQHAVAAMHGFRNWQALTAPASDERTVAVPAAFAAPYGVQNKVWCIFHTHTSGHDHYFHVSPTEPTLDEMIAKFEIDYEYDENGPADDHDNLEIFEIEIPGFVPPPAGQLPRLVIMCNGGLVQDVISDVPMDGTVIDYDVEGADAEDISKILQRDGSVEDGSMWNVDVEVNSKRLDQIFTPDEEIFVIYGPKEVGDEEKPMFWNNQDGWTVLDGATRFTPAQRERSNLPIGGHWVNLASCLAKAGYDGGKCPNCQKAIPDNATGGESYSNCGHVFNAVIPTIEGEPDLP